MKISINTKKLLVLSGLAALWLSNTAIAANEYQADESVIHGSACQASGCQALYGSQESRLNHNVDWLSNNSGSLTYVTCPLPRDSVQKSGQARVKVRVYRPSGSTALDCLFYARRWNGDSWITSDSASVGWDYLDMTLPGNAAGASYAVRCALPAGARIQKINLYE